MASGRSVKFIRQHLTVRLLVACAGTRTTELLGLGSARVGNEQCPVVLQEDVLDLLFGLFVDVCSAAHAQGKR